MNEETDNVIAVYDDGIQGWDTWNIREVEIEEIGSKITVNEK